MVRSDLGWPLAAKVAPVVRRSRLTAADRTVHQGSRQLPELAAQVQSSPCHMVRYVVLLPLRLDVV